MHDQTNVFLAIALSIFILITWQYFYATSFRKEVGRSVLQVDQLARDASPQGQTKPSAAVPSMQLRQTASRQDALARSERVGIETPRLRGSISLRGGRIDDLSLVQYRETTSPTSPAIALLSPSGSSQPFYAEFGWVNSSGTALSGADLRDDLASGRIQQPRRWTTGSSVLGQWRGPGFSGGQFRWMTNICSRSAMRSRTSDRPL